MNYTEKLPNNLGLSSNIFSIRATAGYLFMASIPISYMGFGLKIGGHLLLYETVLIISYFIFVIFLALGALNMKITKLDILVLIYAFVNLIPAIIGWNHLYASAWEYRYAILSPLFAYFAIKFYFDNIWQVLCSYIFFMLPLLFQFFIIVSFFILHGHRPTAENQISGVPLSLMFAIAVVHLYTIKQFLSSKLLKLLAVVLIGMFFMGMVITMSRSPFLALMLSTVTTYLIFKSHFLQKIFIGSFVMLILLFLSVLLFAPSSTFNQKGTTVSPEVRKSLGRLTSPDFYTQEAKGRMAFWQTLYKHGLNKPLFGFGSGAFKEIKASNMPAHPHNFIIHSFLNSGFLGLSLLVSLLITCYRSLFKSLHRFAASALFTQTAKFFFIVFTLVIFVGFTDDFILVGNLLFFIVMSSVSWLTCRNYG